MISVKDVLTQEQVAPALINLVNTIIATCATISQQVGQGALGDTLGITQDENVQGEVQKKLDVIANDLLIAALREQGSVRAMASEEEEHAQLGTAGAPFIVAFDPLDGSSNIDINGQIGTIFTIMNARNDVPDHSDEQFYQMGTAQIFAGYVLYGPYTTLVITSGLKCYEFTLDKLSGEFHLSKIDMKIHHGTREFSANMANVFYWPKPFQEYIFKLISPSVSSKRFNMRWQGAMVGDVHRILTRGGVFIYPSDSRDAGQPAKLRLLYEAFPMALLSVAAGGAAYTEESEILATRLTELHQRVPIILGDSELAAASFSVLSNGAMAKQFVVWPDKWH
jgi:fructose-1,6-bisphosphatase I